MAPFYVNFEIRIPTEELQRCNTAYTVYLLHALIDLIRCYLFTVPRTLGWDCCLVQHQCRVGYRYPFWWTCPTWLVQSRAVDPDSLNPGRDPDPAFQVNPDPDLGFLWLKTEEKIQLTNFLNIFLWSKIVICLSLGLHKGRPSYRRSLHPPKENI